MSVFERICIVSILLSTIPYCCVSSQENHDEVYHIDKGHTIIHAVSSIDQRGNKTYAVREYALSHSDQSLLPIVGVVEVFCSKGRVRKTEQAFLKAKKEYEDFYKKNNK